MAPSLPPPSSSPWSLPELAAVTPQISSALTSASRLRAWTSSRSSLSCLSIGKHNSPHVRRYHHHVTQGPPPRTRPRPPNRYRCIVVLRRLNAPYETTISSAPAVLMPQCTRTKRVLYWNTLVILIDFLRFSLSSIFNHPVRLEFFIQE